MLTPPRFTRGGFSFNFIDGFLFSSIMNNIEKKFGGITMSINSLKQMIEMNIAIFLHLGLACFIIAAYLEVSVAAYGIGIVCILAGASHAVVLRHIGRIK